jgi:hypothetical protein
MSDSTASVLTEAELIDEFNRDMAVWESMRADPGRFFASRSTWPKHLSMHIAMHSTWNWAARFKPEGRYHREGEQGVYHYPNAWPLPVGRRALEKHQAEILSRHSEPYHGHQIVLYDAMPFDGDELAGWILAASFGETRVECFGLTHLHTKHPDGLEVYSHDEMTVRVTSPGRISEDAHALCKEVRSWWGTLTGIRVQRGRPIHSGFYANAEEFHTAYNQALAKLKRAKVKPRVDLILSELHISRSTYYEYKQKYGLGE